MCGRFTRMYTWRRLHQLYNIHNLSQLELDGLRASYNVAPSQLTPVVRADEQGRRAEWMRWGLTPSWSKDGKPGPINAKCETAASNGMFRAAFGKRRCVVPVSGFYEWQASEAGKVPHYIHPADPDGVLSLAGLWEFWRKDERSEPVVSFTVITTGPNELMKNLHDRMPVILPPSGVDQWLDPAAKPDELQALLRPYAGDDLAEHAVSRKVNSPRNEGPELICPETGGPPPPPSLPPPDLTPAAGATHTKRPGREPPPTLFG